MEVIYKESSVDSSEQTRTSLQCDKIEEGNNGVFCMVEVPDENTHYDHTNDRQIAYISYKNLIQAKPSDEDAD